MRWQGIESRVSWMCPSLVSEAGWSHTANRCGVYVNVMGSLFAIPAASRPCPGWRPVFGLIWGPRAVPKCPKHPLHTRLHRHRQRGRASSRELHAAVGRGGGMEGDPGACAGAGDQGLSRRAAIPAARRGHPAERRHRRRARDRGCAAPGLRPLRRADPEHHDARRQGVGDPAPLRSPRRLPSGRRVPRDHAAPPRPCGAGDRRGLRARHHEGTTSTSSTFGSTDWTGEAADLGDRPTSTYSIAGRPAFR